MGKVNEGIYINIDLKQLHKGELENLLTNQDAYVAGMKAFNEYMNTGKKFFLNTCHKLVILKNILKLALIPFLYKQKKQTRNYVYLFLSTISL